MKSAQHLFADITAMLEDLHGLAVEGQAADTPELVHRVLAGDIGAGIGRICELVADVEARIGGEAR